MFGGVRILHLCSLNLLLVLLLLDLLLVVVEHGVLLGHAANVGVVVRGFRLHDVHLLLLLHLHLHLKILLVVEALIVTNDVSLLDDLLGSAARRTLQLSRVMLRD